MCGTFLKSFAISDSCFHNVMLYVKKNMFKFWSLLIKSLKIFPDIGPKPLNWYFMIIFALKLFCPVTYTFAAHFAKFWVWGNYVKSYGHFKMARWLKNRIFWSKLLKRNIKSNFLIRFCSNVDTSLMLISKICWNSNISLETTGVQIRDWFQYKSVYCIS